MATDIEKLVVQLSADFKAFEKSLARANDVTNKQFNAIERRAKQLNKNLDGVFSKSFGSLTAPLAGIGAALGVDQLRQMTDTWTDMTSRVNLAAGSIEKGTEVMGRLGEMARRTYSELTQTAESYLANATALKELGYSTDQSLDYTEALNNALVVSGAKGDRAANVIGALSKAMGLGKLSGVNLNTVLAQGGRVAEALAAGLGTTVGGLRSLGAQGKITGNDLVKALSSQMETLRKEAEAMPATIGDGFTLLNNALLQYVGNADHATGVSARVAEALTIIADNFDKTADAALQVAAVIAGALVGRSLGSMVRGLGLAGVALNNFVRALAAARTMGGMATALGGLGAAAGPVGAIIGGALVASLVLYSSATADASAGADRFAARLEALKSKAEESAEKVEAAGQRYNEALKNALGHENRAAQEQFEGAHAAALQLLDAAIETAPALKIVRDEAGNLTRQPMASPEQIADLERLRDELKKNGEGAEEAKDELFALANSNPNFEALAAQLAPLLDQLALVAQGAREVAAELAVIGGATSGGPTFSRGGAGNARRSLEAVREEGRQYEAKQLRRATLGKEQLALENEIARVKKQSLDDGAKLTDDQIKRIAQANLAGNATRSAEGKKPKKERADEYQRLTEQIKERTVALQAETAALAQVNPLVDDYGYSLEKARATQDLLSAAQKAGIAITPELRAQIDALAEGYASASVEAERLAESQGKARQTAEDFRDLGKEALGGFISDLRQGKSATEALGNALDRITDKLIDMAMNSAFDGLFSGFGGGGQWGAAMSGRLLPGLFSKGGPVHAATGGRISGPGSGTSDSIPAMLSDGEFVVNAAATKKNRALLEAINGGYAMRLATGGFVGRSRGGAAMSGQAVKVNIINNAPATVKQQQRQTSQGPQIDVVIDEVVAGKINRPGSRSRSALQGQYGLKGSLERR